MNAGILGAAAPVIVALVGAVWLHDPLSRRNIVGIALTAVAVLLTVAHGSLDVLRTLSFNRGDIIILGSQLLWTTYTLYSRANKSALPSATVQAGVYAVSALILLPLALFERPWVTLPRAGWAGWGPCSTRPPSARSATSGTTCLRVVGAGRAAVFTNLTPFVVIVLSALTLGEAIRWYHLVGATVVLAGVVLATTK